ncbi:caspase recruitment domain-containing protein 8 [Rhinophrynus dorsalis]
MLEASRLQMMVKPRLKMESPGLFCCSETGIKFLVDSPVTIEYELDSWANHKVDIKRLGYEIVGPVFNIKTRATPGVVLAVYLPHYLCLKAGDIDISLVKMGHYKDDNLSLETPTSVKPYYVELKNPDFSPLGLIYILPKAITRHIPVHGVVLLYCRVNDGYTFHLYLMQDDCSVKKAVDKKEERGTFRWIDKPPQTTRTLYTGKIYIVDGPSDAQIIPPKLDFQCKPPSELYPYCEIYIAECTEISLSVMEESLPVKKKYLSLMRKSLSLKKKPLDIIWNGNLRKTREHFVDRHRTALISRVTLVTPLLDDLLTLGLLTDELYDNVRRQRTSQDQMRKLYEYIRSWGPSDKDQLYEAIRRRHRPLVRDLETE